MTKPARKLSEHQIFTKRTGNLFNNLKQRAKKDGRFVDFDLADIRRIVHNAIVEGACVWCRNALTSSNFSGDHRLPTSRGGAHSIANICICCLDCNLAKGPIEYYEWRELMQVINTWPLEVRRNLLLRLKAGGSKVKGFKMFIPKDPHGGSEATRRSNDARDLLEAKRIYGPRRHDDEDE